MVKKNREHASSRYHLTDMDIVNGLGVPESNKKELTPKNSCRTLLVGAFGEAASAFVKWFVPVSIGTCLLVVAAVFIGGCPG